MDETQGRLAAAGWVEYVHAGALAACTYFGPHVAGLRAPAAVFAISFAVSFAAIFSGMALLPN